MSDNLHRSSEPPRWNSTLTIVAGLVLIRQMLLDRRLGRAAAQLLDIGRHRERIDVMQLELPVLAPIEELSYRACVGGARVTVADAGGEEFDEAAGRARCGRG